jgi:hypothetical protein
MNLDQMTPNASRVFVTELESGPRKTQAGLILPDDNMTVRGIRPRWCQVWKIGKDVLEVKVGDWLLVEHGRWSFGIDGEIDGEDAKVWHIEFPKAVLCISEEDPRHTTKTSLAL